MNDRRSIESYTNLIRVAVMFTMVGAMYISATFSKDGFSFKMGGDYVWMGWGLAVLSTVVQLAWNRMDGNKGLTIYIIGLSTYAYSIYTNAAGIRIAQGGEDWIFPVLLGVFLDIIPEPFFVWAWTRGGLDSDPIGKMVDGSDSKFKSGGNFKSSGTSKKQDGNRKSYRGNDGRIDEGALLNQRLANANNKRKPSKAKTKTKQVRQTGKKESFRPWK